MIIDGREVIWSETFLTSVAAIQDYIGQYSQVRGRTFASEILDYTLEKIAPNPFIFAKFGHPKYAALPLHRAVFQKKYVILYLIENQKLTFLEVYHTSRNPDSILSGEE